MSNSMPIIVLLSGIISGAIAQILLKKSAVEIPIITTSALFKSHHFLSAIAIQILSAILWVFALKNIDLSKAYPLTALAFIIVPFLSYYIFNETVNYKYCLGVCLIICGIIVAIKAK